jgi:hypothetical protein
MRRSYPWLGGSRGQASTQNLLHRARERRAVSASLRAPRHEPIRPDEQRAVAADAEPGVLRDALAADGHRELRRGIAPGPGVGAGEQDEPAAEQIERRAALPRARDPDVRRARARPPVEAMCRVVPERRAGEAIVPAFHRVFHEAIDTVLPRLIERDVARFVATIEASPALRARARLGLEKVETQLAAAIAADLRARPDDLTPRVVAAVVVALERVLLGVLRTHLLRGSSAAVTRRALRRDCDRAFAIVDAGIGSYGARPRAS